MPATISSPIIEALYRDALLLADEARACFNLHDSHAELGEDASAARVALSCEALRTTTRMMHAVAWLLNQRAFFAGEMSELQLRHHGRLPTAQPRPDGAQLALLPPDVADLVQQTLQFYSRVERLDRAWRGRFELQPDPLHQLRERLDFAFAR